MSLSSSTIITSIALFAFCILLSDSSPLSPTSSDNRDRRRTQDVQQESHSQSQSHSNHQQRKTQQQAQSFNQPPLLGNYLSLDVIDDLADYLSDVMYDTDTNDTNNGNNRNPIVIDFDTMPLFFKEVQSHCQSLSQHQKHQNHQSQEVNVGGGDIDVDVDVNLDVDMDMDVDVGASSSVYKVSFDVESDSCRFSDLDQVGFTLPGPGFTLPVVGGSVRNLPFCASTSVSASFVDEFSALTCLTHFKAVRSNANGDDGDGDGDDEAMTLVGRGRSSGGGTVGDSDRGGAGLSKNSSGFFTSSLVLVVLGTVSAAIMTVGILYLSSKKERKRSHEKYLP